MDQFEKLRPVGRLEQYSTARHQIGFYLNVIVAATYELPDTLSLPLKDYVYRACAAVIAEHPVLSAIPAADDTREPYFVRLPLVDLDQVVSFHQRQTTSFANEDELAPDQDLQSLLEEQHNSGFTAPNAFWRLCILANNENQNQFTAVYVFHHALGDGGSGKAFHRSFLQALSTAKERETKSLVESPQTPLLPNIEALHPMPLSFFFLAKKLFQAKVYSRRDPGLWTAGQIQEPTKTCVRLLPFSKSVVTSLRDLCRQEDTTITAVLQTAVARSVFAHIPIGYSSVACTGALSCRRWLPDEITEDVMGVYVQDFEETYTRSTISPGAFPWDEARRSRQTIEAALKRQGKDAGPNLLKYVDNYQQELCLSKLGQNRDKTFEVSNIGVVRSESSPEQPSIKGMVFSQCASVIGNALQFSVITGGDGCCMISLSWQEGVVEKSLAEAVIASLRDELHLLAGTKESRQNSI
ncbi:hypothetical protein N7523_006648 [Penicillium sp. IBT 18751x]|nr:hypothetical protein N7523_006648 [Penicillium sp. IBT 18751x]